MWGDAMRRQWLYLMVCVSTLALGWASPCRAEWITERVNVNRYGLQSNGGSCAPSMSADGRYVAWRSWATDLGAGDTDGLYDVYARDRAAGINQVSRTSTGGTGERGVALPIHWC